MHTHPRVVTAVAAAALILIVAACGSAKTTNSAGGGASRTVQVNMTDNAYQPIQIRVTKGETVTLRFRNTGAVTHEAVLGDEATQARHHAEMTASTGPMNHGAAMAKTSTDGITVEPGKTGELTHMFTASGAILIGCHQPGHWEAGMKSTITVS